ncbi:protein ALP1-like isoform X1 [Portunus trituberculatus]|uniref:protein ALP1-like isoform X1 n=2 Tax=Portunus trituberculatus TaxID=210409 RepID=UPI001E1D08A6|nr:protein ALP1-like isoform X1 [Portunus trituberculatus]
MTTIKMADEQEVQDMLQLCNLSFLPASTVQSIMCPDLPEIPDDTETAFNLVQNYQQQLMEHSFVMSGSTRQSHPKQQGFSQHLEEKDNLDFFRNLRVTKDTFQQILTIVENYKPISDKGTPPVSAKECLQMGLWFLGNKATYREMAELFGLSESTVFSSVQLFINIICNVGYNYIKWPTMTEAKENSTKFKFMAGFPGVVGALDGCHIQIKAPTEAQADYINRTNRHSVNLMAVCNSELLFTFIDVGFPGSAHDSRVFKNTELYSVMSNSPLNIFPSINYHIIGDSAFQRSDHLLTPFRDTGRLTQQQKNFNRKLSQTRHVIENAFGYLKGRFRRLKYVDADIDRIPKIIKAACILHNITLQNPEEESILIRDGIEIDPEDHHDVAAEINLPDIGGMEKSNFIAMQL